jgi:hypothetical protein
MAETEFIPSSKQPDDQADPFKPSWGNTRAIEARLSDQIEENVGADGQVQREFQGHHLISKDSQINGGVYPGANAREAVFVDEANDPELLAAYDTFLARLEDYKASYYDTRRNMLSLVFAYVAEKMPSASRKVREQVNAMGPDELVPLSHFLDGGVCRHQALFAGYLLEKLIAAGEIQGKVSVDRNTMKALGSHAWVRFTDANNEVYILDVTQNFMSKLADIDPKKAPWPYARDEDAPKTEPGVTSRITQKMKAIFFKG